MGYYIDSEGNLRQSGKATDPVVREYGKEPSSSTAQWLPNTGPPVPENRGSTTQWNPSSRASEIRGYVVNGDSVAVRFDFGDGEGPVPVTWNQLIAQGLLPDLPTTEEDRDEFLSIAPSRLRAWADAQTDRDTLADIEDFRSKKKSGSGSRGRSGGTAAKPEYLAPNRDEVEEQLKSYVVATTGKNDPDVLKQAVDAYMKADRAAWDLQVSGKGGEQPSPFMAAKEVVRGTDAYKTIHYLRPDSVDEMDWVTGTQGKLRQLGISAARAEDMGIQQASVGATDKDLVGASEVSLQSNNKLMADTQKARLKQSVSAVARMIK